MGEVIEKTLYSWWYEHKIGRLRYFLLGFLIFIPPFTVAKVIAYPALTISLFFIAQMVSLFTIRCRARDIGHDTKGYTLFFGSGFIFSYIAMTASIAGFTPFQETLDAINLLGLMYVIPCLILAFKPGTSHLQKMVIRENESG